MAKQKESSKTGVKPGATPSTTGPQGGSRPAEEEDTFGGAERMRKTGKDVKSENAKP